MKTIIIGAGMTGLSAAKILTQKGHEVTILDKGRGVGGRMSTRTIEQGKADHGAQYFSVKTPEFQALIDQLSAENITATWQLAQRENSRYVGAKGMNTIPKKMAENLDIRLNEKAILIVKNEVKTESGNTYSFDNLIVTIPIPQAIEFFTNSKMTFSEQDSAVVAGIKYEPSIAVMVVLQEKTSIPTGGIILENQTVAWIADNFQKGISAIPTATLHASVAFSKTHFEEDLQTVSKMMLNAVSQWIMPENIVSTQAHRWRYSNASERYEEAFYQLQNQQIYLAGDGFGVGNVEGAFLSGYKVGQAISEL